MAFLLQSAAGLSLGVRRSAPPKGCGLALAHVNAERVEAALPPVPTCSIAVTH